MGRKFTRLLIGGETIPVVPGHTHGEPVTVDYRLMLDRPTGPIVPISAVEYESQTTVRKLKWWERVVFWVVSVRRKRDN